MKREPFMTILSKNSRDRIKDWTYWRITNEKEIVPAQRIYNGQYWCYLRWLSMIVISNLFCI